MTNQGFREVVMKTTLLAAVLATLGCSEVQRADGLDPSAVPAQHREDYEVFAQRCSRCHSLARPLGAHISETAQWQLYVNRMRRMPGSGISSDDSVAIMRFLTYYAEQRRTRQP